MNEMTTLALKLTAARIPFQVVEHWNNTVSVVYPDMQRHVCDAVCFPGSYGYEKGLLEIMGLTENGDEVEGYLTANEVFKRIASHWVEHRKELSRFK